jgi:hypothetical protein
MAHVDYDKKKFVRDGYGRIYLKTTVSPKRAECKVKSKGTK